MRMAGIEPLEDLNSAPPPTHPPFDPVLALQLAGYSFRAYLDPPSSAHREVSTIPVPSSPDRYITNHFAYVHAPIITSSATGIFMLNFSPVSPHPNPMPYLTACINAAEISDVINQPSFSVLRLRNIPFHTRILDDELHIYLYPSERAYRADVPPTHFATTSLSALVQDAILTKKTKNEPRCTLTFTPLAPELQRTDFFRSTLPQLAPEWRSPFGRVESEEGPTDTADGPSIESFSVNVDASFVPFDVQDNAKRPRSVDDDSSGSEDSAKRVPQPIEALSELAVDVLVQPPVQPTTTNLFGREIPNPVDKMRELLGPSSNTRLPNPSDWFSMADMGRSLVENLNLPVDVPRTGNVVADAPGCLFIKSLPTDTEVWLFRDDENDAIIVSFRGTEQVSWRDFFTDAQLFLQRWTPGEPIDLTVGMDNTVGLGGLLPAPLTAPKSTLPEDMSAVHYGFLQAYMSVRSALQDGIALLSHGLQEEYSFYFTGHSLGGALATLAAVDFQTINNLEKTRVACVTYGAPKVGNVNFSKLYNAAVPNSFRIINDTDLVARMPRSIPGGSALDRYKHSGRTILIKDDGEYWIEGSTESSLSDGFNPFREGFKSLEDLISFERDAWKELLSGQSVQHHMVRCISQTTRKTFFPGPRAI